MVGPSAHTIDRTAGWPDGGRPHGPDGAGRLDGWTGRTAHGRQTNQHSKRTTFVTSLVTRVYPCNVLQGHYKAVYKGETLVEPEAHYKGCRKWVVKNGNGSCTVRALSYTHNVRTPSAAR